MIKMNTIPKSVFGDKKVVMFGWDKFSAGMNMAVDEILMRHAYQEKKFFVRFYDFVKPSVILGMYDDPNVIKSRNAEEFDFSRRITGGKPIFMDGNTIGYSITGPLPMNGVAENPLLNPVYPNKIIHNKLAPFLAKAIAQMIEPGCEIRLGNTGSIKVNGRQIASHAQFNKRSHSFIYHGAVVMAAWKLELIGTVLQVREEDKRSIIELPNISSLSIDKNNSVLSYKGRLVDRFISALPKANLDYMLDSDKIAVLEEAGDLYDKKYSQSGWIFKSGSNLGRGVSFCILYEDTMQIPEPELEEEKARSH